jgi:hypothetical protein
MSISRQLSILLFFASFFLLLSSGRMGSSDAGAQLQAATLLATTGKLGAPAPPDAELGLWVKSPSGPYYECHDIGNIVLMYVPAKIASLFSHASPQEQFHSPSIMAKFGVSVAIALFSAVGCLFMVKLLNCFWPMRQAFLLGLAFVTTTFFWPYTKSAWDVCGGCVGVAIMLYGSAELLMADSVPTYALAAIVVGFLTAVAFRYSLLPFLGLSMLVVVWIGRRKLTPAVIAICAMAILAGLAPTFVYNYVRMGSPLRPATTAEQFAANNGLNGSVIKGFYGLLISPNRGLFEFAPVCTLLVALPWLWRDLSKPLRQIVIAFALPAVLYVLLLSKMTAWGAFGWGPRYLVPILPVVFLPVAAIIVRLWPGHRSMVISFIVLSVLVNGMAVLVNWDMATSQYPSAGKQEAVLPYQQAAVWNGFRLALLGKPLPAPPDVLHDDIRSSAARFPDLWEVRLMERSRAGALAGVSILILLIVASLAFLKSLWSGAGLNPPSLTSSLERRLD